MLAEIKTEKVLVRGEPKWKIVGLKNFKALDECPKEYESKPPFMGINRGRDELQVYIPTKGVEAPQRRTIEIGESYDNGYFKEILWWAKVCGEKLAGINKRQKALQETWKGEKTFTI